MTKQDIIYQIAVKTGISTETCHIVVTAFIDCVKEAVAARKTINLLGFGTFIAKFYKARQARHIKSQSQIIMLDRHIPLFKPYSDFKNKVKKGGQQ